MIFDSLVIISIFVWLLSTKSFSHDYSQDYINCLRAIKDSLQDPENNLASWDFENGTQSDDYKDFFISLGDKGLRGEFPLDVFGSCTSMTSLDLSNNYIHGHIPNICELTSFVTSIDLSSNRFSGEIPVNLANCTYLNDLKLDNNQLTGRIPPQIGLLSRLRTFNVTNNQLSGPVPQFVYATIFADSYANNAGLCGYPLPRCPMKNRTPVIVGAAIGGVNVAALGLTIGILCCLCRQCTKNKKKQQEEEENDPLGNQWAKSIKGAKHIKLSMFEKSVSKMSFYDLMKATNDFSKENIIGTGRTGTTYRVVLHDETSLMVKRLPDSQRSKREFISEMTALGNVKHRNLVPLIGFCLAKKERFIVYKHMPNGTLHDKLHILNEGDEIMDWPLRLKIAIWAAEGFAWLHHSCNPRIIHRNISSKCIFLDAEFEPKISDFELASLMMSPVDHTDHLGTVVINDEFGNSLGYVAPEYARTLVAAPEGDVYSFGVVLLELLTRENPTYLVKLTPEYFKGNLVEWISRLSSTSMLEDAIDGFLVGKGFDSEIFRVLEVACSCVLPRQQERPTMFEVYRLLGAIGQRYNFTTKDEILVLSDDAGDADHQLVELVVARDL